MIKRAWISASNWKNGWRLDSDGWWVRAKRQTDDMVMGDSICGFTNETSVAVMLPIDAYRLDRHVRPYRDWEEKR